MKKLLAILLVLVLSVSINAHGGKTDSSGGHYVGGTDEYHYHHGYPAHDHEDLDEDGDLDCPYDFDDQTDHSAGGSSTSKPEVIIEEKIVEKTVEVPYTPTAAKVAIFLLAMASAVFLALNADKSEKIKAQKNAVSRAESKEKSFKEKESAARAELRNRDSEISRLKDDLFAEKRHVGKMSRKISELENALAQKQEEIEGIRADMQVLIDAQKSKIAPAEGRFVEIISGAPHGDTLDEHGLPKHEDSSGLRWGERYTFMLSSDNIKIGMKFHRPSCRYAKKDCVINAFEIKDSPWNYTACTVCNPTLPDLKWVIIARQAKGIQKKW